MLKEFKTILRENLDSINNEEEEIRNEIAKLEKRIKSLHTSRRKFKSFCQHEAKFDENMEKLISGKIENAEEINKVKTRYLRSIEKDELDCMCKIEELEQELRSFKQYVKQYKTRERLIPLLSKKPTIRNCFREKQ